MEAGADATGWHYCEGPSHRGGPPTGSALSGVSHPCGSLTALPDNDDVETVLVVEDERDIRELLRRYLERAGLAVRAAATGAEALRKFEDARPALVLLDLGLPDIDGSEILARARPDVPVIVLTARGAVTDRIAGLQAGADDYITKPFSPTEVVLRVKAVLRRHGEMRSSTQPLSFDSGHLVIDSGRHEVTVDGHATQLTPSEWNVLCTLAGTPGRVFSRNELVERLSGGTFEGYERAIDSHVKNLRRKLGGSRGEVVETIVGFGYRLALRPDA